MMQHISEQPHKLSESEEENISMRRKMKERWSESREGQRMWVSQNNKNIAHS